MGGRRRMGAEGAAKSVLIWEAFKLAMGKMFLGTWLGGRRNCFSGISYY